MHYQHESVDSRKNQDEIRQFDAKDGRHRNTGGQVYLGCECAG